MYSRAAATVKGPQCPEIVVVPVVIGITWKKVWVANARVGALPRGGFTPCASFREAWAVRVPGPNPSVSNRDLRLKIKIRASAQFWLGQASI